MNPKVIAFYLPQFHKVPENDKWWGEGFTDWVSARNAKPLYPGHYQPRIPAHDNYYDLLDKSTMEWQGKLARKAGIHGFCMYHYWFGDGKQILEKPAENLLKWKDIDIHYCFSWANESWITSWSNLTGNTWIGADKTGTKQKTNGVLLKQKYGNEEEWKAHFMYLLPFFLDERYIKKDGKPVFVIYRPENIPNLKKMLQLWRKLALENGLEGIHVVGTNYDDLEKKGLDAAVQYEPNYTLFHDKIMNNGFQTIIKELKKRCFWKHMHMNQFLNYDKIWKYINKRSRGKNVYPGGYVDFDASPRKGKRAFMTYNATPQKFYHHFAKLYGYCKEKEIEFLFLTAWNEWGEGAYLEPDKRYGAGYLKAIRKVIKDNM